MERRTILVPIDGSDFGRQIFPILAGLIDPATSELVLLRVGEDVTGMVGTPRATGFDSRLLDYDTAADAEQAAHPIYANQERASAVADFITEMQAQTRALEEAGFTVTHEVRFGDRGEQIVQYINNHHVDLIAMTTHWRTGINRILFGNTVQYIVPRVSVPMLMLRPDDAK